MIRKAQPKDVSKIVELGMESLRRNGYEEWFVLDKEKVMDEAKEAVSSPACFVMVSEIAGEIVGVIAARVSPMLFFERSQASVLMFYCRRPGDGTWMMKRLWKWYRGRPAIKRLEFTFDINMVDKDRIAAFLMKLGMQPDFPVYNHIRGR